MALELFLLLLGCGLMLAAGRMLLGQLLAPVRGLTIIVPAQGDGDGLEHTVRGLRWLFSSGLVAGSGVYIRNDGLSPAGLRLAARLCLDDPHFHFGGLTPADPSFHESWCSPSTRTRNRN